LLSIPEGTIDGWSKSPVDPMQLLGTFSALRLREGFVLRGYVFRAGDNGNGIVWAVPVEADFPEPVGCESVDGRFLSPPRPPAALADLMEAIEGDGTAWSYLSASLFAREAAEFGAAWHGCDWSADEILGADPWTTPPKVEPGAEWLGEPEEWEWEGERPDVWEPQVDDREDEVWVTFITYSGVGQQTLFYHMDRYTKGRYMFEATVRPLAGGPGGYVF